MEKRDNQKENNELNEVVPTTDDRQKRYKEEFFKLKLKEQNESESKNNANELKLPSNDENG